MSTPLGTRIQNVLHLYQASARDECDGGGCEPMMVCQLEFITRANKQLIGCKRSRMEAYMSV